MSSTSIVKFEVGVPTEAVTAFMEGWAKVEAAKHGHCMAPKSSFDFSSLMKCLPAVVSLLSTAASSSDKKCPLGFESSQDKGPKNCPVVSHTTVMKNCPMPSGTAGRHLTMDGPGVQKGSTIFEVQQGVEAGSISDLEDDDDPSEDAEVDLAAAVASALVSGLVDDDGGDNSDESEEESAESTDSADVVYGAAKPLSELSQLEQQQKQQQQQQQQMVLPDLSQMMQQMMPMLQGLMGGNGQGFQLIQGPAGDKGPVELESQPQLDNIHTE